MLNSGPIRSLMRNHYKPYFQFENRSNGFFFKLEFHHKRLLNNNLIKYVMLSIVVEMVVWLKQCTKILQDLCLGPALDPA